MGNKTNRNRHDYTVMKRVWSGIEKNPQYHANLFFISFCKKHNRYSKYFTNDFNAPLAIDARTSAKFRLIIEALGYLLLDSYNKPDQLEYIIGYIAMVHKDMELSHSDMINFGVSLIQYLTVTFPQSMTPDCQEIVSNHIHNILNEISRKMDYLKENEVIGVEIDEKNHKTSGKVRRKSNSIYGHTENYWRERKRAWDERLELWKRQAESKVSPPEDDPHVPRVTIKRVTVASVGSDADQFLKSYGVIEEIRQTSHASRRRRPTLMTKRSGEMQYKVVETMIDALNRERDDSITTDSTARQRRRQRHSDKSS